MRIPTIALALVSAFALTAIAQPQQPPRPEILILGVYHMNNPGRDIFNMQADDVLSPKRQTEITQVIEALKQFKPTKIAIETDVYSEKIGKQYADYLAGKYTLTRNEDDQIGFRLAKELGHAKIYAVDVDGDFPFQHLMNFAKASGRSKEMESMMAEIGAMVKAQNDFLASHTILETLLYMNADAKVAEDVGFYYREARFGEPGDWAGADLVADWFRRNMRIYANITQLIDSPNERILVIYGAGHLGWLQRNVTSDPMVRLRKLAEFAK